MSISILTSARKRSATDMGKTLPFGRWSSRITTCTHQSPKSLMFDGDFVQCRMSNKRIYGVVPLTCIQIPRVCPRAVQLVNLRFRI